MQSDIIKGVVASVFFICWFQPYSNRPVTPFKPIEFSYHKQYEQTQEQQTRDL